MRSPIRRHLIIAALTAASAAALVPATADAALIAAYDKYVQGKGFEIGLIDADTGAPITVPTGVNTSADEFHPALTPDGKQLVFTRATLQPQLNGDIIPPEARDIVMVNLAPAVPNPRDGFAAREEAGAGATIVTSEFGPVLAYGVRWFAGNPSKSVLLGGSLDTSVPFFQAQFGELAQLRHPASAISANAGDLVDFPHAAAVRQSSGRRIKVFTRARFNANGTVAQSTAVTYSEAPNGSGGVVVREVGLTGGIAFPQHPTPRTGDFTVAMDAFDNGQRDIKTSPPTGAGALGPVAAPTPVNTSASENMPAWSPDGVKLGFVRTSGNNRSLLVYNSTPGLQTVVNPGVGLGVVAPNEPLRGFQDVWGGVSLATIPGGSITCLVACQAHLETSSSSPSLSLTPSSTPTSAKTPAGSVSTIGIFISKVVGKRKLFGVSVPRIRAIGRVPLGAVRARKQQSFRWNGKVNGKRLAAGTYLLTFRGLNSRRQVLATSQSLQFRLTAGGKITNVRAVA